MIHVFNVNVACLCERYLGHGAAEQVANGHKHGGMVTTAVVEATD